MTGAAGAGAPGPGAGRTSGDAGSPPRGAPAGVDVAFTLIDAGRVIETRARIAGDGVRFSPDALEAALGWALEDGVLCRDAACVPVPDGVQLDRGDGIDLAALATVLDRPLALDVDERAAFLGEPVAERRRALGALAAPDFALPDLAGRLHRLSEHRGRKVLLLAWASW